MPQIDRIKISQEINYNGMPTWIGIEAALLPGEDEKEGLRQIQKVITEYQTEEQKAFGQSKWGKPETKPSDEIQAVLDGIDACIEVEGTGDLSLSTFWLRSKGNLVLSNAYKAKEKQLQNL